MFQRLVNTGNDWSGPAIRLVLAIVFFTHGTQKLWGWFGGKGLAVMIPFFAKVYHMNAFLVYLLIAVELGCAVLFILGFLGRLAALGSAITMIVAAIKIYQIYGHFFMNWGSQPNFGGEGCEYHLIAIVASLALLVHGSGALSIDRLLSTGAESSVPVRRTAMAGAR
jgi:putative oxidoreductase